MSMIANAVPCAHLRHKGMYVLSETDEHETSYYDRYDARVFWCTCTQKPYGPDGAPGTFRCLSRGARVLQVTELRLRATRLRAEYQRLEALAARGPMWLSRFSLLRPEPLALSL